MARTTKREQDPQFRENQILSTAKRALGLNKYYVVIAIIIGLGVLFLLVPTYVNSSGPGNGIGISSVTVPSLPLLAVPFTVLPMIMLTTPDGRIVRLRQE
jgi:hypothetical protein